MDINGLHNFIETHLDEKLTNAEKRKLKRLEKHSLKYEIKKISKRGIWQTSLDFSMRHFLTAALSIAVCLAVALPIALGSTVTVFVPEYRYIELPVVPSEPTIILPKPYTDICFTSATYEELSMIDNLLLFADGVQIFEGAYRIESEEESLAELGYTISDGTVDLGDSQTVTMNCRIRTRPDYAFHDYYDNYYATLVDIHNRYAADRLTLVVRNFEKNEGPEVINPESIDIDIFFQDDIAVVCHVRPSNDFAFIHFNYKDNGYFIKIENDCEVTLDTKYIQNVFLAELFGN